MSYALEGNVRKDPRRRRHRLLRVDTREVRSCELLVRRRIQPPCQMGGAKRRQYRLGGMADWLPRGRRMA